MSQDRIGAGEWAAFVHLLVMLAALIFIVVFAVKSCAAAQETRQIADETCVIVYGVKCDDEDGKAAWLEEHGLR